MGIMERRNFGQIKEKYNDLYKPALLANWKVWPAAQVSLASYPYRPCSLRASAYQFPIHAPALSRPIPVWVWCILDAIPVSFECKVRPPVFILAEPPDDLVYREDEKQDLDVALRKTLDK